MNIWEKVAEQRRRRIYKGPRAKYAWPAQGTARSQCAEESRESRRTRGDRGSSIVPEHVELYELLQGFLTFALGEGLWSDTI